MPRRPTIMNALLGVALAASLGNLAATALSHRLARPGRMPAAEPATPRTAAPAPAEPLAAYAPILSTGLFGKATAVPLQPVPAGAPRAAASPPAELVLLGTASGSSGYAMVRHAARGEERVFGLGEEVFGIGRLSRVGAESVTLSVGGQRVELFTPSASPVPAAAAPPPVAAGRGAGLVIDQRALNAALDNAGQLMTDARLVPSSRDGKVEGFRASEVKAGGFFAMLGIRNGDTLVRLNDLPLDSPDRALQTFVGLKGQSRLRLDLQRDGRPLTMDYEIR